MISAVLTFIRAPIIRTYIIYLKICRSSRCYNFFTFCNCPIPLPHPPSYPFARLGQWYMMITYPVIEIFKYININIPRFMMIFDGLSVKPFRYFFSWYEKHIYNYVNRIKLNTILLFVSSVKLLLVVNDLCSDNFYLSRIFL